MNYIPIVKSTVEQIENALAENMDEEETFDMKYYVIVEEINELNEQEQEEVNYLIEWITGHLNWNEFYDILFGNDPMVQDYGIPSLYNYVVQCIEQRIQERNELGHSRIKEFQKTRRDHPYWLVKRVAESQYEYYRSTTVRNEEYEELLEEILEE